MSGVVFQGINYPSLVAVMGAMKVKKQSRVLQQIQYIEIGALGKLNDREDVSNNSTN